MRLLRTLALLALIAGLATACGSRSSSSSGSAGTGTPTTGTAATTSDQLQVRPVFARYTPGVQFGPQIPQELVDSLSHQPCPMKPASLQDMLLECDAAKTVYLMKDPITSGGVATAVPKQIGQGRLWYVQVTLDPETASTLAAATKTMTGTEIAYSFEGSVLTSVIVDSSFDSSRLAMIGDYDEAGATHLADQLTGS